MDLMIEEAKNLLHPHQKLVLHVIMRYRRMYPLCIYVSIAVDFCQKILSVQRVKED